MNTMEITDSINKGKVIRSSNLELLRLVCMLYIVIHHILIHALHQVAGYGASANLTNSTVESTILDSFFYVAVNSFILISGYFSIRLKPNKLIHLYVMCAFYGTLFYFMHLYLDHQSVGKTFLSNSVFVISNTQDWWFIQSYFFLCLLSPLLNKSVDFMSKKEHLSSILLLTFINVYFGYFWHNPVNSDGYNVMNFIYLYVIGQYIKKYISIDNFKPLRFKLAISYVFFSFLLAVLVLFNDIVLRRNGATSIFWTYNDPIVIISSIIFFCIFLTFDVRSRIVNWLATSTLAVYLIHENGYSRHYIYDFIGRICKFPFLLNHLIFIYLSILLLAILLMITCILFDKLFQKVFKPVENLLLFFWNKIESKYTTLVN